GADLDRDQVEPPRLARRQGDERDAALVLLVADLGAYIERLGVAGRRHEVRDHRLARALRRLPDLEDGEAGAGFDGEAHDAFFGIDVDRLRPPGLRGLAPGVAFLAAPGLEPDVLEELELLVLERLALADRLPVPRLGPLADIRELTERAVGQREGEEVVVPDEVDAPAVPGEDRARLGRPGIG